LQIFLATTKSSLELDRKYRNPLEKRVEDVHTHSFTKNSLVLRESFMIGLRLPLVARNPDHLVNPGNSKQRTGLYSVPSEESMKKLTSILVVAALTAIFGTHAFAQSSGSANFASNTTACTDIGGLLGGGAPVTSLKTTLHMSSGNGNALIIRPSAVTGLLTN